MVTRSGMAPSPTAQLILCHEHDIIEVFCQNLVVSCAVGALGSPFAGPDSFPSTIKSFA